MKQINKGVYIFISICTLSFGQLHAQVITGTAPGPGTAAENNPYANYFQKWTPMMQKLFQQVKNDKMK